MRRCFEEVVCHCSLLTSQLLSEENEDELIEKYKARRWLVRVTRKNLRWEVQQKLFAPYDVLSFQELIGLVLENNWEILEDIDQNEQLFQSIEKGDIKEVFRLIHEEHVAVTRNNSHALFLSCFHGLTEVVTHLLSMKCIDPRPSNSLAAACETGQIDIVRMLLNDPRVDPTMDESMPIQLAAQSGHSEIVKLLLEDGRANPNRAAGNPLVCASAYGDVKVVGLLLSDPRVDPAVRDNLPLLRACEQNAMEVAQMLLRRPEVSPHNGNKPLLSACTAGNFEIVKLLVNEYHVDPASPQNQPFFNACYSGNLDLVKFLLSFDSVDPSQPDNNASFQIASQMGHTEIIDLLIKDPRVDPTVRDNYSLDISSVSGYLEVVKILLADPRVRNTCDPSSPIRLAVEGEQQEVLRYFLSQDDPGFAPTPLLFCEACEIGDVEIVKILMSDPRVHPHAHHFQFPVQFAAAEGHLEVYKLLVADPRVHPEEEEDYALVTASQRGHTEIVKEMLADPRIQSFDRALIEASLGGVDGVVKIISTSDRIDRTTLASSLKLSEAFGKACENGYADCVRNLLEGIPQFQASVNDILEASRLGHVGTLRAIHELRTIDCEEAVAEAGTEEAFLHLLAWWSWRRWRLLKLGLTDISSYLSILPTDLYLDFVRVLKLGFDQEVFRS